MKSENLVLVLVNEEADNIGDIFGISKERATELDKKIKHLLIDHSAIHKILFELSKECVHQNEFALVCFAVGKIVTSSSDPIQAFLNFLKK